MSMGDVAQMREIAEQLGEQVGEAVLRKYLHEYPHAKEAEIPAPLKWGAAVIASLFIVGISTFCFWMVSTLNQVQLSMVEIRAQLSASGTVDLRFQDIDRRVQRLESFHAGTLKEVRP